MIWLFTSPLPAADDTGGAQAKCWDVDNLLSQYPVRVGSSTRWMSRLDDGTLLSLKPHG